MSAWFEDEGYRACPRTGGLGGPQATAWVLGIPQEIAGGTRHTPNNCMGHARQPKQLPGRGAELRVEPRINHCCTLLLMVLLMPSYNRAQIHVGENGPDQIDEGEPASSMTA